MITESVVKQAKNGDKIAFQTLYEEIYIDMYRMAFYLLQNRVDAEDAVSEAVFDMYRGITGLKKWDAYKSWAMKILSVKCKLKMREYSQRQTESTDDVDVVSKENVEGQIVLKTDIMKAMTILSHEEQVIVICSAVAGMSSDEVSSVTGLKSATVRTKLSRALTKLRNRLEAGV